MTRTAARRARRGRPALAAITVAATVGLTGAACTAARPPTPAPATTTAPATTRPVTTAPPAPGGGTAREICEKYGSTRIQGGRYLVQNNNWGSDITQCIAVTDAGFAIARGDQAKPTNGPPGSYPSVVLGCHYGNCTAGSGLPAARSSLTRVDSAVTISTPAGGEWDAAYDIWFDPAPRTDGQNNGAEIMVWLDHRGRPQPLGSKVASATIAGTAWDVWFGRAEGNGGWNVVSYVRQQPASAFSGDLLAFVGDATARGHVQPAWYLTSVQFGFEPWTGGPGLAVESFSASVR